MRRRHSSGFKMLLRGKPALILLSVIVLAVFVVLYFRRSSPSNYSPIHAQHEKRKSFNMGSNNFDPKKFVVDNNAVKQDDVIIAPPFDTKDNKNDITGDRHTDVNGNAMVGVTEINNKNSPVRQGNVMFESPIKNKSKDKSGKLDERKQDLGEIERLYTEQYSKTVDFQNMKHIVHFDFKGAVPKMEYLYNVLPFLKSLGVTGLLVEYEDMFPYDGLLASVPALNALTKDDLSQFLNLAKQLDLEIIPLIQTFGHMEFILKLEQYAYLRESDETPQVIAPGVNETYILIQTLIDQIMNSHPSTRYIHLGCDEVYQLGRGRSAVYMEKMNYTKSQVFFEHISRNVVYIKQNYPQVTPIIWDDEFRFEPFEVVQKFGLGDALEPMIWSYLPNPRDRFTDDIWDKYGKSFKNVWAASSFKGATGSSQFYTNITHHLGNHLGWVDVITEAKAVAPKLNFRGVAMTGWQRYDHFATLCELFPAAIPSLALSLTAIIKGGFTKSDHMNVKEKLRCIDDELLNCTFPGDKLFKAIYKLKQIEDRYNKNVGLKSRLDGWLTDYNIEHGFGSPGQLRVLEKHLNATIFNYTRVREELKEAILKYYDIYTADEWLSVHIDQKLKFFVEKKNAAQKLINVRIHSRRPLLSRNRPIQNTNQNTQMNNNPNQQVNVNHMQKVRNNPNFVRTKQNINQMPFQQKVELKPRQSFEFRPNDEKKFNSVRKIQGRIKEPILVNRNFGHRV